MQIPNTWHWHNQDREIRDYVEDSASFIGGIEVKAVTSGNQLIPALLDRIALEDVEEDPQEVEYEDTYHNNSDCKEQRQVSSPGGIEDPRIL